MAITLNSVVRYIGTSHATETGRLFAVVGIYRGEERALAPGEPAQPGDVLDLLADRPGAFATIDAELAEVELVRAAGQAE